MDKLFNNNWLIRLTALLLAIALFFYVQSENNSTRSTPSEKQADVIEDVKLEVYYDDENLIVTGLPETVNVGIEGPTPIVMREKLAKDYKVFVDLSSLSIGEHRVTIQTENFSEKLEVTVYPQVVNISIEEKVTKEFRVEPEINSRQIKEGYVLKNMLAEPKYVFVTGAKSVMDSINYVKASIKAEDGITQSFKQQANVKVLDRDLNKLDVTIQPEAVEINVEIDEYNREIPLTLKQTGQLPEGITINELSLNQESIKVSGPQSIVDSLNEMIVEFDLSKLKESGDYEAKIQKLENPMKLSNETVTIHANITVAEDESETSTVESPETDGNTAPVTDEDTGEE
ncbi:CdaR family protein [Bacillus ndiopicus]|uniref:CdaR family protein n=1 Tax=Bacillus ndiopicus TaxID=1347368 RepID=UPI0005A8CE4F|nr:CdaR family protein [Bacillus ndiopicus]